jgi:hypothetical protein
MKLFSPTEHESAEEERHRKDTSRADTLQRVTDDLLKARAKAETDFEETLQRQQVYWENLEAERRQHTSDLKKEVVELEERKREALIPIYEELEKLHNTEEELVRREETLIGTQADLEMGEEALMRRIDEVAERESQVTDRLSVVVLKEKGAETQRADVARESKSLSKSTSDFQFEVSLMRSQQNHQQALLDGKEVVLDEERKKLDARKIELDQQLAKIHDREAMLERDFAELKLKKHARIPTNTK